MSYVTRKFSVVLLLLFADTNTNLKLSTQMQTLSIVCAFQMQCGLYSVEPQCSLELLLSTVTNYSGTSVSKDELRFHIIPSDAYSL